MPTQIYNQRTGQVRMVPNRVARRMGMVAGRRGSPHRFTPPPHAGPPAADRTCRQEWTKDRKHLDLRRPLPPGSTPIESLRRINHGLFYAWNLYLCRWELWCDRSEWSMVPYFVLRIAAHPNIRDPLGFILQPCPARPRRNQMTRGKDDRWTGQPNCPAACPGLYLQPDDRLLPTLHTGTVTLSQDAEKKIIETLEADDLRREVESWRFAQEVVRATWGEHFNQLVGIQQTGYTGKESSSA